MSNKVIQEPVTMDASQPPKKMTKEEMLHKIIADQKFLEEARQKGISYQELSEKYGYSFATV